MATLSQNWCHVGGVVTSANGMFLSSAKSTSEVASWASLTVSMHALSFQSVSRCHRLLRSERLFVCLLLFLSCLRGGYGLLLCYAFCAGIVGGQFSTIGCRLHNQQSVRGCIPWHVHQTCRQQMKNIFLSSLLAVPLLSSSQANQCQACCRRRPTKRCFECPVLQPPKRHSCKFVYAWH